MAWNDTSTRSAPGATWTAPPPRPLAPSFAGVLSRRFWAYLVDIVVISILVTLFGMLIAVAGVLTLGLGWMLYGILVPATAILYSAATVGGPRHGTFGMRMFDLAALDSETGGPVGWFTAAIHATLFYLAAGTLILILDVLIGFARADARLGHDLVTGVVLVRRGGAL